MKNIKTLLWIDDVRNPNEQFWLNLWVPEFGKNKDGDVEIIWVKNYKEFVEWIQKNGLPTKIAFDHDLGEIKTGYHCAKYLVNYCIDNNIKLPFWVVQSSNPVGRDNINGLLNNFIEKYENVNK